MSANASTHNPSPRMLTFDDKELNFLFEELDQPGRHKALKAAIRQQARKVRKVAVNNLRASGLHVHNSMQKGIKALVFRKKAGFRVTIGAKYVSRTEAKAAKADKRKAESRYHVNRYGMKKDREKQKDKPVLIWAETGTEKRYTKRGWFGLRRGRYTGRMKRYGFMAKTKDATEGKVSEELHKAIIENIKKISKKHGCT